MITTPDKIASTEATTTAEGRCCLALGDGATVPLSGIPTDRVVWITYPHLDDLDAAVTAAPPDAPAVIALRVAGSWSLGAIVASTLDELEKVAGQLFPAWLPGAEGITTSAGAAQVAVRRLAIAHAAQTDHYGPFLADLAAGAVAEGAATTRRHQAEVRARGLARVLASSFGRSTCALLLRPSGDLDGRGASALVQAGQWLISYGRFAVWLYGASPPAVADSVPELLPWGAVGSVVGPEHPSSVPSGAGAARSQRAAPGRRARPPSVIGKPHPSSQAEVMLESALAGRSWAAGRAWNHTVRPGPLVNPVRVDLLWKREQCIIEIDGDDHRAAGKYAEDRRRDVMLQLSGYAVLRFTNAQVLDDLDSVLTLIHQFLAARRQAGKGN